MVGLRSQKLGDAYRSRCSQVPVRWGSTMMVFRAAPWWLEPGSLRCRQLTRELGGQVTKMPVSSIYGRCGVTRTLHATPGYTKDPGVLLQ